MRRYSWPAASPRVRNEIAALGLDGWKPPQSLSYTGRASQAFAAGRIDAEHFQEQYFRVAILDAHAARRRARELLVAAQHAAEIAIEQDETAALAHLAAFDIAP